MSDDAATATTEAPKVDLFAGTEIAGGFDSTSLVFGEDFYDERDESDGSYQEKGDPISQAVGTPGYMSNHVVDECFRQLPDGSRTEPPEFDRYYFPPQDRPYSGPAPVLMDILEGLTPEERSEEADTKEVAFKAEWCRSHGLSYVVLHEAEDLYLSTVELRAKIARGDGEAPAAAAKPTAAPKKTAAAAPRKRGAVQRPRKG